ncbi:MAG: hypothetical protein M3463_21320, partial [Verrucomicrobiota bacterium]|nr:hypothetical protein [Verrucomicrobiota bacterium]
MVQLLRTRLIFCVVVGFGGAPACQTTFPPGTQNDIERIITWTWVGGMSDTRAVVVSQIQNEAPAMIVEADNLQRRTIRPGYASSAGERKLWRFELNGLRAGTRYRYSFVRSDGTLIDKVERSFRTFPAPGKPSSFRFIVSSCAEKTNSSVFTAALRHRLLFFLHTGDFYYSKIKHNDAAMFRMAFHTHLRAPQLSAMLCSVPLLYMWDDHDFGRNDSNRATPTREAALEAYRKIVPHFPFAHAG